ncbi:MAG: hypothetical protein MJ016_00225 [Victivallaceae bacterium]|nr:hypothetical protein [Victivallaceae bacterium]
MAPQRFFAGGKINLFLKTERLRADGFHDISTLFLPFSRPADILTVEWEAPLGIHVTASSPDVPEGKDNLVYRAAMRYAEAAGIAPNWSIHIEKHLPVAAGVGGGSADAGCILAALEKRYTRLGGDALFKIAASVWMFPFSSPESPGRRRDAARSSAPWKNSPSRRSYSFFRDFR